MQNQLIQNLGPSFKVKRWFTGFGQLSFQWIQICIGSPMCRSSSWIGHWWGSVGILNHGVNFNLGSVKVCSPAIFERYFSYDKDV